MRVAVERVGSRLGHIRDLRARKLSVLAAVGIRNDGRFGDFILPQRKVRRARVVNVEIRVHVVFAVDREQVRGSRHTVGGEVAVPAHSS